MAFKGAIKAGKKVRVELALALAASGEALVFVAAGSADGSSTSGRVVVVPGGKGDASVTPENEGILDIEVDFTDESDSGELTVFVSGKKRASATITGDTSWSYAIT